MTSEEAQTLIEVPDGLKFFEYLSRMVEPVRVSDCSEHARSLGLPEFQLPVTAFLAAPIPHRGRGVGNIYLAKSETGELFTQEDEETLVMFASHAALVISNARRYRDERQARADLEAVVNTSPVGVAVFDLAGKVVLLNRETKRILGDTRRPGASNEQLPEDLKFRFPNGRETALDECPFITALLAGKTVRAEEIVIQIPDGREVTTLVNATPIHCDKDQVISAVVTLRDMTPREELERMRSEFLGMVSHALRAPLTSIKGSATALRASSPLHPAETRQFFRIIDEQADHMHDLINNLLDVTRIETGTLSVIPEPTDLAVVVDQAGSTFLSGGVANVIEVDLAPDLPRVMADRRRILQVLGNLFSNASRYSPEASTIRVTAVRNDIHVALSVVDEGRGVSDDRLPHLFLKFSRTDGEPGGSGVGLAICKGFVEAHGGRIWADNNRSEPGSLSQFPP